MLKHYNPVKDNLLKLLKMIEFLLKNILQDQDIFKSKFLVINMETMFISIKEIAQFKGDIKKLFRKLHLILVIRFETLYANQL